MEEEGFSFEAQVEEATKRAPVSVRTVKELLEDIGSQVGILALFHFITENPNAGRMLFLSPLDLFGTDHLQRSL